DALRDAPADLACWAFLDAPSPKAMWARRQAHETTIHRVDAELAAAAGVTPIAAELAIDGIDELLTCFVPRPRSRLKADPARSLRIVASDVDDSWLITIGANGPVTARRVTTTGDATVTGRAEDLYLTLWSRTAVERV